MFNFFKKSINKSTDAWKQGVKLSGIDINLPFISISISPDDSQTPQPATLTMQQSPIVQEINQTEQPLLPRQELKFNIIKNLSDELAQKNQLMVDYFYNSPEFFDGKTPRFNSETWRKLEGNIQLVANEPLWIVARFRNVSGRVLYKVPVGLKDLPFIDNSVPSYLNGHLNDSEKVVWVDSSISGFLLETMNANDWICVHCFCRTPQNLQSNSNFNFANYLSTEKDGRKLVEDIVHHDFEVKLMEEIILRQPAIEFIKSYYQLYNSRDLDAITAEMVFPAKSYYDLGDDFDEQLENKIESIREDLNDRGRFLRFHKSQSWDESIIGVYPVSKKGLWQMKFDVSCICRFSKLADEETYEGFKLLMTNNRKIYIDLNHYMTDNRRTEMPKNHSYFTPRYSGSALPPPPK